ncbi:MAG: SCO family protein [Betaproteobacteria bacterium]|nr:SCO family protein [Betaproteobacteria bacterium]
MRRLITLFVAVAALFGCSQPSHFVSTDITGAAFGREFTAPFTDHTGQPRRLADFKGKVVMLFFGYTQCPDVCPTTLASMAEVMKLLGSDAARVQVLFITVDPERDTRQLLAAYVPQFNPSFIGLYADPATTAATALEFKVFYQKQAGSTPNTYTVDHSANSYIYDPQGRLRLYVKYAEPPASIAADIKLLLAGK